MAVTSVTRGHHITFSGWKRKAFAVFAAFFIRGKFLVKWDFDVENKRMLEMMFK